MALVPKSPRLICFDSPDQMAAKLADVMAAQLALAVNRRAKAVFAVSGGSTPRALHGELAQRDLRWRDVTTVLVDERWIPPGQPGSNEDFVIETLRKDKAAHVPVVGLYRPEATPGDAAEEVAGDLDAVAPDIDVLHLGMGPDGHTASWFPHAQGLNEALSLDRRVAAVTAEKSPVTGDLTQRITLTLGAVSAAKNLFLMITGAEKRAVLEAALEDGPVADLPVRAILKARPDIWLCWAP